MRLIRLTTPRTFSAFALGALLWASWRQLARTHRTRLHERPAAAPPPLQAWDNEGGNSQMRPDVPAS